jgi:hypothetical protein
MCRAFFDFRAQCLKRGNAQESDVAPWTANVYLQDNQEREVEGLKRRGWGADSLTFSHDR